MKNSSYKSIQSVELSETKETKVNDMNSNGQNGCIYPPSNANTKHRDISTDSKEQMDISMNSKSFTTERERISFNAMISLRDIELPEIVTIEHKICAIIGFMICVLIIIVLSYGGLSHWSHSSYIIDPTDNITKIYNTSFTVTCSWNALHKKQTIPEILNENKNFKKLCQQNITHSCSFNTTGKIWFILLLCSMVLLFLSSMVLVYPKLVENINNKLFKLKYVKYMFLFCGLLMFISIIPITLSMNIENDLCGNKNYNEWNKDDNYNGYVENIDEPLWTVYLSPVIGMLLWFSACFLAQIGNKPDLSQTDLFNY